jgi:two-component system cell cycle sensor histidine kinase/response regulator CckA
MARPSGSIPMMDNVRETVVALVTTFLLGGFFTWVVELSHPATVLALVIVYFSFRGGLWPGLAAALVTVTWSIYAAFNTVTPRFFPTESMQRLAAVVIAMPVLAGVVARLRVHGHRAEVELRAANEALQALINASPLAIYTLDRSGIVRSWNSAAERMFGWKSDEVVGSSLPTVGPDMSEEFGNLFRRVLSGDTVQGLKVARRRKDDTVITVSVSAAPLADHSRHVTGVLSIASDITGPELADEALRRQAALLKTQSEALLASEGMYRMLLDQAADGIFILDAVTGSFQTANTRACEMLGYSWDELKNMTLSDVLSPADLQGGEGRMGLLRDGGTLLNERTLIRKDGTPIPVEISSKLLPNGRLQSIARDITDRRRAEAQLRDSDAQLRQAQKMEAVGRLAGGIAHDFNNLLTAIQGHTQLLLEEVPEGDPTRVELDAIQKATERTVSLTRQLLAFSRKQVLQPKVIALNAVVRDIGAILHRLIGEDIILYVSLESGLSRVMADPGQVQQVLLNLVVNARDAMPGGGTLTVETRNVVLDENFVRKHPGSREGHYVALSVADSGTGMDADTLSHVFEPFFTTKPPGSGTGLGLATVYGIVKQSDGYISVDSEAGKGATFTMYLPRVDALVEEPAVPIAAVSDGGSETILLVEDEEAVRSLVRRVLERKGYQVFAASNGQEALDLSTSHDVIDLLITDVIMPEMGGRELASRLAQLRPSLRILFMSGYSEEAVAQHGVFEPGTAFLEKPFTPDTLVEKVRAVLDTPLQITNA